MNKSKWGVISDIVRLLANYGDLYLNETESQMAHHDLANIMDYMITQNCGFKKALSLYRQEGEDVEWIEGALEKIT